MYALTVGSLMNVHIMHINSKSLLRLKDRFINIVECFVGSEIMRKCRNYESSERVFDCISSREAGRLKTLAEGWMQKIKIETDHRNKNIKT